MNVQVFKDSNELITLAEAWAQESLAQLDRDLMTSPRAGIYLPAGKTALPLYKKWNLAPPPWLLELDLIPVDDLVQGPQAFLFHRFFKTELSNLSSQLQSIECVTRQAELGILGLGENGHVAFHEPGVSPDFFKGSVFLRPDTCRNLGVPLHTVALTYGLTAFLKTQRLLLIVSGEKKRDVFRRFINRERALPASLLHAHPHFQILVSADLV